MALSLREVCDCIGLSGQISVVRDFFGYRRRIRVTDSLLTQLTILTTGKHINLNIIMVGSNYWRDADRIELEGAIRKMREIFAQVNIGIGRIEYYPLTSDQAWGREIIDDDCEAIDLTNEWTIPNNGLDVFIVLDYVGSTTGLSAVDGPCDKNAWFCMSGSVAELQGQSDRTGTTMAHEVGHYLGLHHVYDWQLVSDCLGLPPDWPIPEGTPAFYACLNSQPQHLKDRLMFPKGRINNVLINKEGSRMREYCLTFRCDRFLHRT